MLFDETDPTPTTSSHPAKFSNEILDDIHHTLTKYKFPPNGSILDPFAGTGKISKLKTRYSFGGKILCNDIEDWGTPVKEVDAFFHVDSEFLTLDHSVDAIITSPTYGNRMADHFESKDNSKRYTYKHGLGKPLHTENTGRMHFGDKYCEKHRRIYRNLNNLLTPGGLFIINVSDFIRKKTEIVPVNDFHHSTLTEIGYDLLNVSYVKTHRMKNGQNGQDRVSSEAILTFRKSGKSDDLTDLFK